MDPMTSAALVTAGANLLSRFIGGGQQKRNISRTNQANINLANLRYKQDRKMAEYAYSKDLEMWELQNQYNSPAQQMKRFEDAGLNKHMIYGQGTPGNATGMPIYTPPSYQPPTVDYRGTPSEAANVLGSITGATSDYLQIKHQKEKLDQAAIDTWVKTEIGQNLINIKEQEGQSAFWKAKSDMWNSRIQEIKGQLWEKGISPSDATWLRMASKALNHIDAPKWILDIFGQFNWSMDDQTLEQQLKKWKPKN